MLGGVKTFALLLVFAMLFPIEAAAQLDAGQQPSPAAVAQSDVQKARQLLRQGQSKTALRVLLEAVKVFPGNPEVHFWLGVAFQQLHDQAQAMVAFNESLVVARMNGMDSPEARCNLGNLQEQHGKLDEAIANYRQALQVDSHFIGAHLFLVRGLLKKHRPEEALAEIQRCSELGCNDPSLTYYRALALRQLGKDAEAQAQMQQFLAGLPANVGSDHLKNEINCRFTPIGAENNPR
jgi:Flp pilus assembly protein TadD